MEVGVGGFCRVDLSLFYTRMNAQTTSTSMSELLDSAASQPDISRPDIRSSDLTWGQWFRSYRVSLSVAFIVFVCLLGFAYFQFTTVTGHEFNARTWEIREFSFRRDPFTNRQLTGIRHEPCRRYGLWTPVGGQLQSQLDVTIGALLSRSYESDRWELIGFDSSSNRYGDPKILIDLLQTTDPNYDDFWIEWTTAENAKAAVLWPAAQDLVYFGGYRFLPDLLAIALLDLDQAGFSEQIETFMVSHMVEVCQDLDRKKLNSLVRPAARAGLRYGDHPELLKFEKRSN